MLKVSTIKAFSDNYIWCVINEHTKQAVVIDPGCSHSVLEFLASHQLELIGILITHHHPDHIGGVEKLKRITCAKTYGFSRAGPKNAKLKIIDNAYNDGDTFVILGMHILVMEVPGHTLDHIAFYSKPNQSHLLPWLFCGDTLFSAGCGRLFEGTPAQMHHSLTKFTKLPSQCEVYCAHEYTLANLDFASSLMPNNEALQTYTNLCRVKRANNESTLPTNVAQELKINPFLRMNDPELISNLGFDDIQNPLNDAEIFAAVRKAKDIY